MNKLIPRNDDVDRIKVLIKNFPVTAILGPRQCGKSTLSKYFNYDHYFDLENPRDERVFENPQLALEKLKGLVVIDEIQRIPDLFPLIRYLVDNNPDQKYLIVGSASKDLIKQGSESLAGRIAYYELTGFRYTDVNVNQFESHWLRGALPRSYLAENNEISNIWRINYIQTFLERDIPQLGITIPAKTLRRFWIMLSHYHGQLLNYSELSRSFGISDKTARHYLEILEGTFMIRLLQPWFVNISKRLVKAPKLYIRDSGIFHCLQSILENKDLYSHPKLGASWEGYVVEEVSKILNKDDIYFWRTHNGAELDLFWQSQGKNWGIEVKYSDAPGMSRALKSVLEDLDLQHIWIVYAGGKKYQIADNVTVLPFLYLKQELKNRFK
jgi:predicted AAA+ superfamily ATPase